MKNKKIIIIVGLILIVGMILVFLSFNFVNKKNKSELVLFPKEQLIEDYYIIDDYEKNIVYTNKIYVPNYMTKQVQKATTATYLYKNDNYSLQLNYKTYLNESDLNNKFVENEKFKKKDYYYYLYNDNKVKIYFENEFGYYQAIEISIYSRMNDNKNYYIDSSFENLLKNLVSEKKNLSDYSIKNENGYYLGSINYNYYNDENDKIFIKADYKVSSEKYGSNYDSKYKYQELYLDNSNVSFYEGEITTDILTVKNQTRIRTYFSKIYNFDINEEAVRDLQYPLNQTAFTGVTKEMVKIEVNALKFNGQEVKYYRTISNNNNSYGERIYAYLPIKDDIYYIVQIYGGDNKKLDINKINDFLPTKIEIK